MELLGRLYLLLQHFPLPHERQRHVHLQTALSSVCMCIPCHTLQDCPLPHDGYGHVILGKPSPFLFYPISKTEVRDASSRNCSRPAAACLQKGLAGCTPVPQRHALLPCSTLNCAAHMLCQCMCCSAPAGALPGGLPRREVALGDGRRAGVVPAGHGGSSGAWAIVGHRSVQPFLKIECTRS